MEKLMKDIQAGCSAISWNTEDKKWLFGRNFDLNRMADITKITYFPKDYIYYTCGTKMEGSRKDETRQAANYAAVGTGLLMEENAPVLYEGINEYGLMGAQLNYRVFAEFSKEVKENTLPVQPAFFVYHMLAQYKKVSQIAEAVEKEITFLAVPMAGVIPTLHWMFTDAAGESIVIESEEDGVKIYKSALGVMTNSPGYSWQKWNLLNYCFIKQLDHEALHMGQMELPQYSSGSGALGLPGDWSSPSRFVRLAFMKKFAQKGKNEKEGVARLFRLLTNVAFPLGMVEEPEPGPVSAVENQVLPYDYTIYSTVMCAQSLRFYWMTYENTQVQYVDLKELMEKDEVVQFEWGMEGEFVKRS